MRWIGAILIIFACGGFGYKLVLSYKKEEKTLLQLIGALDYMACELQYRLTPLPELCRNTAAECRGNLSNVFLKLAYELEDQVSPDVDRCMQAALSKCCVLPQYTYNALDLLGRSLGRFDIHGQLLGLEAVRQYCRQALKAFAQNKDIRLRGYQTLALCAGAALVILFI